MTGFKIIRGAGHFVGRMSVNGTDVNLFRGSLVRDCAREMLGTYQDIQVGSGVPFGAAASAKYSVMHELKNS